MKKEHYIEKINSIDENEISTEISFNQLPYYINSGHAFCNIGYQDETKQGLNFKLSEKHLKMIIAKSLIDNENILGKIIKKIKDQKSEKRQKDSNIEDKDLAEKIEKKAAGVNEKFIKILHSISTVKDYEYISEVIKLIYLLNEKGEKDKEIRAKKDPLNEGLRIKSIDEHKKLFFSIQSNFNKNDFITTLQELNLYNDETEKLCKGLEDSHLSLLRSCSNYINKNKNKDKSKIKELFLAKIKKVKQIPDSFNNSHCFCLSDKDLSDIFTNNKITDQLKIIDKNWEEQLPYKITFQKDEKDKLKIKLLKEALNFATSNFLMQKMAQNYLRKIAENKLEIDKLKAKEIKAEIIIHDIDEKSKLTALTLELSVNNIKFKLHASEFNQYRKMIISFESYLYFTDYPKKDIYTKTDLEEVHNQTNKAFNNFTTSLINIEISALKTLKDSEIENLIEDGYVKFKDLINQTEIIKSEDKERIVLIRNMVFHNDIKLNKETNQNVKEKIKKTEIEKLLKKYNFEKKNTKKVKKN